MLARGNMMTDGNARFTLIAIMLSAPKKIQNMNYIVEYTMYFFILLKFILKNSLI